MLNLLFNAPQNYAWVLNYGRRLLEDETKDMEKNRTEHQINTRIYNNAFCGLLRTGYPFDIVPINSQIFLKLVIDNIPFQCPANTVSNILRQEYDAIVKPKMDTYNEMADKKVQHEDDELIIAESKQSVVSTAEDKKSTGESPAPSVKMVSVKDVIATAASTSMAEPASVTGVLQQGEPPAHYVSPPMKIEKELDDTSDRLTPQKRMEIMRDLKKQEAFKKMEEAGSNDKTSVKEGPFRNDVIPKQKHDAASHDGGWKNHEHSHLPIMMTAPNLDDIIFTPVIHHKKVVEIGGEPGTPSYDAGNGAKEVPSLETPERLQPMSNPSPYMREEVKADSGEEMMMPDILTSMASAKGQKDNLPSSGEATIDVLDTGNKLSSGDSLKNKDETSACRPLEFDVLLNHMDPEMTADKPETMVDQPSEKMEHVPYVQSPQPPEKEEMQEQTSAENSKQTSKRIFQPKAQRFAPKTAAGSVDATIKSEDIIEQAAPKEKKGLLSALFGGGDKKKEEAIALPASAPQPIVPEAHMAEEKNAEADTSLSAQNDTGFKTGTVDGKEGVDDVPAQADGLPMPPVAKSDSYNYDGGDIFMHIHQVVLKKQFGNSSAGPYRFIFWPLRIIEMQGKKTWADFLVHVTDQNGNEILLCTDGKYKELMVKVDGKEFNVYATWTNGMFDSHVSLYGKTASIYTIEEDVHKEEPETAYHDSFLNQFRLERKGQPKHFVVPFKNNNRGELNIPIVGCVELGGKSYPLERREENTLRYRYNGSDKVIRGHWEKGMFKFTVDDANRFVWEGSNE